ncbi:hypothetical protein SUGI_0775010 [Cryptomeria japonica]|nr:hypothetical protein SUGI_0775010 [Cryptomeria japonica]
MGIRVFGCLYPFSQFQKRDDIQGIMAAPSTRKALPNNETFQQGQLGRGSDGQSQIGNPIGENLSLAPSFFEPKIFVIRGDYFNKVLCEVSTELVWFRWFEIGQRNLPSRLSLKNLCVLELYEDYYAGEHHLKELWKADNDAPVRLRVLVISGCNKFQRFPDSIGRLSVLKKIVITVGFNLKSLPEGFCRLQSLEHLQLSACHQLASLPTRFGNLRNLQFLDLSGCTKLRMLPDSFKKLMLLQHLDLESCSQLILTSEDFQHIKNLKYINLCRCEQLEELPSHITNQASLRELYLEGAERLKEIPIKIGQLSKLREMSIGKTRWDVPSIQSLERMKKLRWVELRANKGLAIESCFRTIQKCPREIRICTRVVPVASSLVDSLLTPNLVVVNSFADRNLWSMCSSNGDTIMFCFLINCVVPQMTLSLKFLKKGTILSVENLPKLEKGRWAWVGVFASSNRWAWADELAMDEVEKGWVVRGEEQRVMEAFHSLLPLLQSK